jgi:hypothetical protein
MPKDGWGGFWQETWGTWSSERDGRGYERNATAAITAIRPIIATPKSRSRQPESMFPSLGYSPAPNTRCTSSSPATNASMSSRVE